MQIVWNGMIVDGIFRSGSKSTNEIKKTLSMLKRLITRVRKEMGDTTTMVMRLDGGYYDQLPVNYTIKEDNKINIAILGRSGKFDKFTLINKDDKNMTLKARFGAIYQFAKK